MTREHPLTPQSRRRGVQLVACCRPGQASHALFLQPGQQLLAVPMLPGNAPHVLRRAGVTLDDTIAHPSYLRLQLQTALGEHPHGTKRDGKEPNPTSSQLKIAVAKMLPCSVMDRLSSFGQAKRSIDGNEVRLCLLDRVQNVFIAERDVRLSTQAAKKTQPCRTARRTREVDPENDKRYFASHSIRPQFTFLAL